MDRKRTEYGLRSPEENWIFYGRDSLLLARNQNLIKSPQLFFSNAVQSDLVISFHLRIQCCFFLSRLCSDEHHNVSIFNSQQLITTHSLETPNSTNSYLKTLII
jgi:hypothetical protein